MTDGAGVDLSRVTLSNKIVAGCGVLLVLVLCLAPWHSIFSMSSTATQGSGAVLGSAAVVLTGLVLLALVARRVFLVTLPELPRSIGEITVGACCVILALLVLKLALDPEYLGFGAPTAIVLAAGMAAGAFLDRDDRDEAPPVGSTRGAPPRPF